MLTEIVLALGYNSINKRLLANGRATNHHHLPHQGLHHHHPDHLIQKLDFSSLLSLLHFPVIIPSIMHKLTRISIPTVTSLFVILTYVRLIIKSR